MDKTLLSLGRLAGAAGTLLCALCVIARLAGYHWIAGVETLSLLQAGIASTVVGCFLLLTALTADPAKVPPR